ncbi:MAG TPA: HAD family hydrolase [Candidatus Limnocylindrales bacterium]|nr:HAD family hydrolase [Candidatus Limnocylindrales bacterium]
MRGTEAILFDAAGTLFDLEPDLATRLAAAVHGLVADPDAAVRGALSRVNDRGGWPEDQPDARRRLAAWTEFVRSILDDTGAGAFDARKSAAAIAADIIDPRSYQLFPETLGVLDLLFQAGVPCAIVSNFDDLLLEILDHLDIRRYFAAVVHSAKVGVYKPDARIFARAISLLGVDVGRAVMVGDSPYSDIDGARSFGLRAVLIDRKDQRPGHEGEVVTSLGDLPSLLFGASARGRPT